MHLETFIPAFLLFAVLGLILPVALSSISMGGRLEGAEAGEGATAQSSEPTVYEQLGGAAAIDAAVDIFYRRVLADAYVRRFFEGVDMEKQAAKQKAFLTMVTGGPNKYTGKDMREGHKHLLKMGLNDTHFDHILTHLRSTLAELKVPDHLIQTVISVAESTRDDVLNR